MQFQALAGIIFFWKWFQQHRFSVVVVALYCTKKFNPQIMLHWGVQCENRKKTPQHKSTYTINTTLQHGETYPALASSHPVRRHSLRRWSQTRLTKPGGTKPEALGRGRGIMSVIGEGARESHCSALPRVIQHGLGRGRLVRGSQKR